MAFTRPAPLPVAAGRRRTLRTLTCLLLLILAATTALATEFELPSQIQFGPVAKDPHSGASFARAVQLPFAAERIRLEASSPGLFVEGTDDGHSRLVLSPQIAGPVSGSLVIEAEGGRMLRALVAGEVVVDRRDSWPAILVRQQDHGRQLLHSVRLDGLSELRMVAFDDHFERIAAPGSDGWQQLPGLRQGAGAEQRGRITLQDGSDDLRLQVSALEVISVLAKAPLSSGVRWARVLPLRERMGRRGLRARIAVAGRANDVRALRVFDLFHRDGQVGLEPIAEHTRPAVETLGVGARMLPVRVSRAGGEVRARRILELAGERAFLIDPRHGVIDAGMAEGRYFTGAAAPSVLHANTAFALRRDLRANELAVRRWSVAGGGEFGRLRSKLLRPSLGELLGGAPERAFDAVVTVRPLGWPQQPLRERLYVLGRYQTQPRIWAVRFDGAAGRLLSVRARWAGEQQIPEEGPTPRFHMLPSQVAGSFGLPTSIGVSLPAVQMVRILERRQYGARFSSLRGIALNSTAGSMDGLGLFPRRLVRMDRDGQGGTVLRRFASTRNGLIFQAGGLIPDETTPRRTVVSERYHGAWLLTGKTGERYLRYADLGLRAGINLPPIVDVGRDIQVRASSGEGALVRLRARARDANGDPLSLRWSAPGIRFDDPSGVRTRALFPVGTTQVRLFAREGRALAKDVTNRTVTYEASDALEVTVEATTAVQPAGLRTAIAGVFPNPANPRLRVAFSLESGGPVALDVIDVRGRHVRTLLREHRNAGPWDVVWDGVDDEGRRVASGVYHVRLRAGEHTDSARVALVQ